MDYRKAFVLHFIPCSRFSSYIFLLFLCLISFLLLPFASLWENARAYEFHISYCHTEWYILDRCFSFW